MEADSGTEIRARPTVPHLTQRRVKAFPGGFRSSGSPLKSVNYYYCYYISYYHIRYWNSALTAYEVQEQRFPTSGRGEVGEIRID